MKFKSLNNNISDKIFNIIIFFPIISFIIGFYLDENSAGMGEYAADSDWIKKNIEIFLQNNLWEAIFHPDLFGNRTPLIYVLNKIFNPFFNDFEKYRISVFLLSILGPFFFYQLLKVKYVEVDKRILFLISSIIYLSPYYRTSAFWGLNENYGIISTILTFLFLTKFLKENGNNFYNIILIIIFSSLSIYFDQKFLIVPLICFIYLILSPIKTHYKFLVLFSYIFLSIPYLYLFYRWGGIVPKLTQLSNPNTVTSLSDIKKLYFIHIGYSATLISFYLLPLFLFLNKYNSEIFHNIKKLFYLKKTYFFILIFISFNLLSLFFFNFEKFTITDYWVGLGVVHKLTIIMTDQILLREIITYLFFFFSFFVIYLHSLINKINFLIILYFILISLFLWPLMQEYFDPIILILFFSTFKSVKSINKFNSILLFLYMSTFLIIANLYYF